MIREEKTRKLLKHNTFFLRAGGAIPQISPETYYHRWTEVGQGFGYRGESRTSSAKHSFRWQGRQQWKRKCSMLFKLFLWYWHGQTHAVLRWQRFAHDAQVLRQKDLSRHMSPSSWTAELHEWHWNAPLVAVAELPARDWSHSSSLYCRSLLAPWLSRCWPRSSSCDLPLRLHSKTPRWQPRWGLLVKRWYRHALLELPNGQPVLAAWRPSGYTWVSAQMWPIALSSCEFVCLLAVQAMRKQFSRNSTTPVTMATNTI